MANAVFIAICISLVWIHLWRWVKSLQTVIDNFDDRLARIEESLKLDVDGDEKDDT